MKKIVIIISFITLVFSPAFSQKKKSKQKNKEKISAQDTENRVISLIFKAEHYELLEKYAEAASAYRECINISPQSAVCYYKLATLYSLRGDINGSINLVKQAIEIEPDNKWYILLLSHDYIAIGDYDNAIEYFVKTLELDPFNIDFQLELAELYIRQGNNKKAIELLDIFEKKYGINPEINVRKQNLYLQNGQIDKAIDECLVLIDAFPEEPNYYGLLAEMYLQNKEDDKALETYNQLLEIAPENGLAHFSIANYYHQQGQEDKARNEMLMAFKSDDLEIETKLNVLKKYIDVLKTNPEDWPYVQQLLNSLEQANPNNAATYTIISDFKYQRKDIKSARQYIYKSLELEKDKIQVWNRLIVIDSELQDWKAMVKDGEAALELFPSNPGFYYFLGVAYFQDKKYDEAIEVLETGKLMIFQNENGIVDFQILLADAYNNIGSYKKSDENYDKVLENQPDNDYVLNNYSYYLSLRKDKLDKALEMGKKLVELKPGQYNYQDTYGWVLFQSGNYKQAVVWLEKAVNSGGSVNGEILEHYGDALFMDGNKSKALEIWKMAKSRGDASEEIDIKIKEEKITGIN